MKRFFLTKPFKTNGGRGTGLIFGVFLGAGLSLLGPVATANEGDTVEIVTCGNLDTDNRANWCAKPDGDGGFVQGKSQCRKISEDTAQYIHCSGSPTLTETHSDICCMESTTCPGAFVYARCVN